MRIREENTYMSYMTCIALVFWLGEISIRPILFEKPKDLEKMVIISEPIDEDDDELFKNSKTYSAARDDDDDTKLHTH